jgi:hypothetical protein
MQQSGQLGWARHGASLAVLAVLEGPFIVGLPAIGPLFAGKRPGSLEVNHAPAIRRYIEVLSSQCRRLLWPHGCEIEAPEECDEAAAILEMAQFLKDGAGLDWVRNAPAVDRSHSTGCAPFQAGERIAAE